MLLGQAIPDRNWLASIQIGHVCHQESIDLKCETKLILLSTNCVEYDAQF